MDCHCIQAYYCATASCKLQANTLTAFSRVVSFPLYCPYIGCLYIGLTATIIPRRHHLWLCSAIFCELTKEPCWWCPTEEENGDFCEGVAIVGEQCAIDSNIRGFLLLPFPLAKTQRWSLSSGLFGTIFSLARSKERGRDRHMDTGRERGAENQWEVRGELCWRRVAARLPAWLTARHLSRDRKSVRLSKRPLFTFRAEQTCKTGGRRREMAHTKDSEYLFPASSGQ